MEYNTKEDLEKAAKSVQEARALVDFAKSEGREMTEDEEKNFDSHMEDQAKWEKSADRKSKLNDAFKNDTEKVEKLADKLVKSIDEIQEEKESISRAMNDYLRNGSRMSQESFDTLTRAQTVGTNSEGGFTVDSMLAAEIDRATLAFGGVRSVANVISTSTGGDLNIVTNNDTGNVGSLLAESGTASTTDTVFGNVTLGAFKYTSDAMLITRELLQDSQYNLVRHLGELMAERIGRITNLHYTTGDGSSKPLGVAEASTLGKAAAAVAATTFSEMLDLKHSVDPSYRTNASWMFNDSTLVALKKVSITTTNQSLWQPGIVGGAPATIDGQPYTVNQNMESMAAGTRPILYGDFKKYWVRDVAGIEILRGDELNMLKGQVTFVAFSRTDADLINTSAVKHIRMSNT